MLHRHQYTARRDPNHTHPPPANHTNDGDCQARLGNHAHAIPRGQERCVHRICNTPRPIQDHMSVQGNERRRASTTTSDEQQHDEGTERHDSTCHCEAWHTMVRGGGLARRMSIANRLPAMCMVCVHRPGHGNRPGAIPRSKSCPPAESLLSLVADHPRTE